MEEIMNEMRKDLGLKKSKRKSVRFFVNDIKSVLKNKYIDLYTLGLLIAMLTIYVIKIKALKF